MNRSSVPFASEVCDAALECGFGGIGGHGLAIVVADAEILCGLAGKRAVGNRDGVGLRGRHGAGEGEWSARDLRRVGSGNDVAGLRSAGFAVGCNTADAAVDLAGWTLRDRAGNVFKLSGTVPAKRKLTITMSEPTMPLNNDGDEVQLIDGGGTARSRVAYAAEQATAGVWIEFGR